MSECSGKHDTILVERNFMASPERVFAAWADPKAHGLWKFPGDDWELAEFENDFRVGGREKSCFGPKGDPKYCSDGNYLDIVPQSRIVSAGTMHDGIDAYFRHAVLRRAACRGTGTRLILTDQSRSSMAAKNPPNANRVGERYWTDWNLKWFPRMRRSSQVELATMTEYSVRSGETITLPANIPHAVRARRPDSKCCLP